MPQRARPRDIGTVSSIPVTGRVVAVGITILVPYPAGGTALRTVGDRPRQVHLHSKVRMA